MYGDAAKLSWDRRQVLQQLQAQVVAGRGARIMLVGMAGDAADAADHAAVLHGAIRVQQLCPDTADIGAHRV